ncbi:hypothetical protein WG922_04890 [Ramlibacter sp. AN1015]|uniref:hypothetical protein n=1 Tax=Ramlibacter sp. AN1015 TaxID=3133428 RepID=UPI0030C3EA09
MSVHAFSHHPTPAFPQLTLHDKKSRHDGPSVEAVIGFDSPSSEMRKKLAASAKALTQPVAKNVRARATEQASPARSYLCNLRRTLLQEVDPKLLESAILDKKSAAPLIVLLRRDPENAEDLPGVDASFIEEATAGAGKALRDLHERAHKVADRYASKAKREEPIAAADLPLCAYGVITYAMDEVDTVAEQHLGKNHAEMVELLPSVRADIIQRYNAFVAAMENPSHTQLQHAAEMVMTLYSR